MIAKLISRLLAIIALLLAVPAAAQAAMAPVLAEHGWRAGRGFALRTFPGTAHNEAAWRARIETPLAFLLRAAN